MSSIRPLPDAFLDWQVKLRAWTMTAQRGAPHAGVAPLLSVRTPDAALGVTSHAIICGLLPAPSRLLESTKQFRELYEGHLAEGARATYDAGIGMLKQYYRDPSDFDPHTVTTLLPKDLPVVDALRADPNCSLLFYVFDLKERSEEGRFRCWQLDGEARVHEHGEVYDNVWWHNALFHGRADDHVVIQFLHHQSFDTRFGALERLD